MLSELLLHARWVIPMEPSGTVLEHHSVVVDQGRIAALMPTAQARQSVDAAKEVELSEHALLPGFINAHTHAPMDLLRGYADDLPLMDWLNKRIWPAEQKWVDSEFVRMGSRIAIAGMLRRGITCFNDMYFFPDAVAEVAVDMGMRAMVGIIVLDFPSAWAQDADEYLSKGTAMHDRFKEEPLISTTFAPHAPYTVSAAPLKRIAALADELDVPVHMHVHETEDEVRQGLKEFGKRPLQWLDELGLVNERLVAVHATQLEPLEIELLARQGASVVHCPESNLKLASGICPVHQLRQAGVTVCLGTDGAASNNDLDFLGEMRTAALLAKGSQKDASILPAKDVLCMGTIDAARALGKEEEIGSLREGKFADLCAVDLSDLDTQPVYDPISQIVYAANSRQISDVWIGGVQRLQGGKLVNLDIAALAAQAAEWGAKIADNAAK
ncbi:MAG: TRZ/ATZ family hydrolase [Candidatus Eutrophobiaceae bacterium]